MATRKRATSEPSTATRARDALQWLEKRGTAKNRDGLARFGIVAPRAYGVSVAMIKQLGKQLGRDHALALALWKSGWYEARMLAAFVDEPALVTVTQMNAWARDFDNWAICDHCCFHLFDRTPHAWGRIAQWSGRRREFEKRAAFALLASVALHDKRAPDAPFVDALPWIERAASDERNFVKKGVSWALRSVGRRRGVRTEALLVARRLADSEDTAARWVGRDALRDLQRSSALAR